MVRMEMSEHDEVNILNWAVEYALYIIAQQAYILFRTGVNHKKAFFIHQIGICH